jgi:hypothetical protein
VRGSRGGGAAVGWPLRLGRQTHARADANGRPTIAPS